MTATQQLGVALFLIGCALGLLDVIGWILLHRYTRPRYRR